VESFNSAPQKTAEMGHAGGWGPNPGLRTCGRFQPSGKMQTPEVCLLGLAAAAETQQIEAASTNN
jgi:hypothetical protein